MHDSRIPRNHELAPLQHREGFANRPCPRALQPLDGFSLSPNRLSVSSLSFASETNHSGVWHVLCHLPKDAGEVFCWPLLAKVERRTMNAHYWSSVRQAFRVQYSLTPFLLGICESNGRWWESLMKTQCRGDVLLGVED